MISFGLSFDRPPQAQTVFLYLSASRNILGGDAAMTSEEIVQALRCCQFGEPCDRCPVVRDQNCVNVMHKCAADLIERLTAENAALREKQAEAEAERDALLDIAKNGKDCDTCKHCEVCVQPGIDVAHWCDRCVEKCPCHGCGGDHWEWRGLPEAPEEGDKHGTADK
jgi:hypothetical protein